MTAAAPTADGLLTRERLGAFLRKYLIVFIFLGMCVLLAVFSPNNSFLKPQNLINVVRQISVIGLLGARRDGVHHRARASTCPWGRSWACRRS